MLKERRPQASQAITQDNEVHGRVEQVVDSGPEGDEEGLPTDEERSSDRLPGPGGDRGGPPHDPDPGHGDEAATGSCGRHGPRGYPGSPVPEGPGGLVHRDELRRCFLPNKTRVHVENLLNSFRPQQKNLHSYIHQYSKYIDRLQEYSQKKITTWDVKWSS